jgi:hypothetical protein
VSPGDARYLGATVPEEHAVLVGARRVEALSEDAHAPTGNRVRGLDASNPRLL